MRGKLLNSVKVKYLQGSNILAEIHEAAKVLKKDPNIVKIYLFGSFVREDFVPGSDADICIVMKEDHRRIIDRIPQYLNYFSNVSVPVDIFPYTIEEFDNMKRSHNNFAQEIITTGREL